MANTIKLKRKVDADGAPTTGDLVAGELAINAFSGRLFLEKSDGGPAIVEMIHDQGGQTIGGALTITGAFTSLGIDDNATAERLQIEDTQIVFSNASRTDFTFAAASNDQTITISGGTGLTTGSNIILKGGTHASNANDMYLRAGNNHFLAWDESVGDFEISTGTGSKTIALTINSTQDATFAGAATVTGTFTTQGAVVFNSSQTFQGSLNTGALWMSGGNSLSAGAGFLFYGGAHATRAGDFQIRGNTVTTDVILWDESDGELEFFTGSGGPKTLALSLGTTQIATFAGDVNVQGAFTSIGIDDNATSERLQIGDSIMALGPSDVSDYTISRAGSDDGSNVFRGGNGIGQGAGIYLYGGAHSSSADDILMVSDANQAVARWDESMGNWTFSTTAGASKTVTLVLDPKGADLTGGLRQIERADHAFTPAATFGELWVRNDAPNVLVFTDDAGTDWDLNIAGASGNVSNTGTPLNDQIAVWTDATTVEGTTGLTYNGTALNITGNITLTGTVDGIDIAARDHDSVTFAGTGTYISLAGQVITVDPITQSDISDFGGPYLLDTTDTFTGVMTITGSAVVNSSVYLDTGLVEAGRGSGSVALTINDGYGNANIAFNHRSGSPDFTGSSGRIECAVDSATASMNFELGDSTVASTPVALSTIMNLTTSRIEASVDVDPNANNTRDLGASGLVWANVWATTFEGTATTAQYADLAEKYTTDDDYGVGTVLMFGGDKEVTEATPRTTAIAGIVSEHPAFLMNKKLDGAIVALRGRVPCKVYGSVSKGDLMVAGTGGVAVADNNANPNAVLGRALANNEDGYAIIEVVV